jgi:uncharacterized membrane protein YkvA (DUF1232 family)
MGDLAVDSKEIADGNSADLTEIPGLSPPGATSEDPTPQPAVAMTWRQQARLLQKKAHVFYFVSKHPNTPWYAKLVAACTAGYLFSPVQIIPNYIPVIGMLDDVLIVYLGVKLIQRITPADVLAECRALADAAEVRRNEKIRSTAVVIASVVIATVWFLAAVIASVLMAKYFRH